MIPVMPSVEKRLGWRVERWSWSQGFELRLVHKAAFLRGLGRVGPGLRFLGTAASLIPPKANAGLPQRLEVSSDSFC